MGSCIADANPCKDEREEISHQAACIAEKTLDGVGESFLFLIHHVAHHHFEGLHGHIDGGIEEHQRYQTENHGCTYRHAEASGIG